MSRSVGRRLASLDWNWEKLRSFMRYLLMATLLLGALAQTSFGGDIIDQSYIPITGEGFNSSDSGNLPIGQEFTPTLNAVSFVDLYLGDAGSDIGPGTSFQVVIHSGSIAGTVLGTSDTVFVPDGTNTGVGLYADFIVTRFTFAAPVSLVPNSLNVIQIEQLPPIVTGNFNFAAYGGSLTGSTYPGGQGIVSGAPVAGFDFAFSEGIFASSVPEPSTFLLGVIGAIGVAGGLLRRRRTAA
jgi:PEP-CTERM motif